ncbi:MAG: NAD-dependent epimerase/dehydratase family protein [Pseudomonadota bacterium]
MRCLVVGGTGFLGGAIADALVAAGHELTIMSRGQTKRSAEKGAHVVKADRYGDLTPLSGGKFDWVFDSCAFEPDAVRRLLDAVGADISRYVMISSISAYGSFAKLGLNEDDRVPNPTAQDLAVARSVPVEKRASAFAYGKSYGPLKRACELAAAERLGDRATLLRVGLLVGAGDYTDRLTWWVRRIDEARDERRRIPVPAPRRRKVQLIDVRDAAEFGVLCAENDLSGIWNVTGQPIDFGDLLGAIQQSTGSQPEFCWFDDARMSEVGVAPWTELPLIAPATPDFRYFLEVGTRRAVSAGLRCRPLVETLDPLLAWDRGRRDQDLQGGLSGDQEIALLS